MPQERSQTALPPILDGRQSAITVEAAGRSWRLERAANLEELWQAMTENTQSFEDERLPYWTELWPSSMVLANWLAERRHELAGKPCLDMGCGLGLTAMAGQWLGARITAMDYEPEALRFAAHNARINQVAQPFWLLMDWRHPALQSGCMARIWGGDIMYEKRFVDPVLRFLAHALAPDGIAWVAEPGRSVYEAFLHALSGFGFQGRRVHSGQVRVRYDRLVPVTVHIWELTRRPQAKKS
ncbi:MAG: 50S ribosomal protein L11 methyltransferase [Desulfovibrionaceae bacterium]|nr:50S ribosomal protein L11 methyltransferase [Desulfovibrionaceae bacterium]